MGALVDFISCGKEIFTIVRSQVRRVRCSEDAGSSLIAIMFWCSSRLLRLAVNCVSRSPDSSCFTKCRCSKSTCSLSKIAGESDLKGQIGC